MKKYIALYLSILLVPAIGFGAVIVDDDFSDLDRSKTGLLDADWWSSSSTSGNSVEIDASGLGLITGTSGRGIHATFAPTTLAVGETITATIDFTTPATVGFNKSTAFKLAMMSLNNPALADDLSSSSSAVNPLYVGQPGYMSDFDVNGGPPSDISIRLHDVTSPLGRFLGTTSEWTDSGSSSDAGYMILANTDYVATLSVERTVSGVTVASTISQGGSELDSHSRDYTDVATDLGMLGIWGNSNTFGSTNASGDPDNGITLTRVQVEVIPEPATLGLLGISGAFIFAMRRLRRS